MSKTVCFISDFGLDDAWVGVCHAVMHRACPHLTVVDLSHEIPPFDVRKAAAVGVAGVWQVPWAVHLIVVDPGVGGARRDLAVACRNGTMLVGPDNGVLMPAAMRCGGVERAWRLDPDQSAGDEPLATFHARDVLAPAAAALACGTDPSDLGHPIDADSLASAPFEEAMLDGDTLVAEVVDVDRFGSVRLSVTPERLALLGEGGDTLQVSSGHVALTVPLARTFSDVPESEAVALWDSSGWLTLAVRRGSAADRFVLAPGSGVRVRRAV